MTAELRDLLRWFLGVLCSGSGSVEPGAQLHRGGGGLARCKESAEGWWLELGVKGAERTLWSYLMQLQAGET